jgi:hypothetical protein
MTENPTINLKELTADLKTIKESLAALQPKEPGPKGHTEESLQVNEAVENKKKINTKLREFIKTAPVGGRFTASEAIGAQTSSAAIPTIWTAKPELLSPANATGFFLTDFVTWKEDVKGKPGSVVDVQTISAVADAAVTSGTEPTFTASTITTVPVTLTQRGHGFYISKGDLEDVQDGTLEALVEQSRNAVMRGIDAYFLAQIQTSNNNVMGGTFAEGGAMAATVLTKLWGSLMVGSYPAANAAVIMHPVPYASLLRDAQFVNAATFGDRKVVETGAIPRYLGMDIVPMLQGTLNYGGTAGTYKTYAIAKGALVGAIKREIEIEKEYYVKDQRNYTVVSTRFGGTPAHPYGIAECTTID